MEAPSNLAPSSCGLQIRDAALDLLVIMAFWSLAQVLVGPRGDFPLNDDWSFGRAAKILAETGDFRPTGWTSMPLISHAAWGSLFCLIFGFSFDALRASTLVLSLSGVIATYALVRNLRSDRAFAMVCALTLCFNPIYFALSNTYMTDVPFVFFISVSVLFFIHHIRYGSNGGLFIGTFCLIVAILCRQLAIIVPIAFSVVILLQRKICFRSMTRAFLPLLCSGLSLISFNVWLERTGRLPALYYMQSDTLRSVIENSPTTVLIRQLTDNFHAAVVYLGLFLLPVLAISLPRVRVMFGAGRGVHVAQVTFAAFIASSLLLYGGWRMPFSGNIIVKSGIGPLVLRDVHILNSPSVPQLPGSVWIAVTAAGTFGAACLLATGAASIACVVPRWRRGYIADRQFCGLFTTLSGVGILLPLLISGFFDRYLIVLIPLFAGGLSVIRPESATRTASPPSVGAAIILLLFAAYSVGGAHDYISWNRARWQALNDLLRDGKVTPAEVDGGFEFNGLNLYDPNMNGRRPWSLPQGKSSKSWWWVRDDRYIISFGPIDGWEVMREYPYAAWMPVHTGYIFVLARKAPRLAE